MYFFTADEHYSHANIIKYTKRPFNSVEEMNESLINNFNGKVGKNDITIHAGDFTLINSRERVEKEFIKRLNGQHIFLMGSHDSWLSKAPAIWQKNMSGQYVVVCHYAMRVWPRSHYNSWQLYGHSHGKLEPIGKQWDIGVDNNNYEPLSWEELEFIMKQRPNNLNLIK